MARWFNRAKPGRSLGLLVSVLLALAASGCGGSNRTTSTEAPATRTLTTSTPSIAARPGSYLKVDGDSDNDDLAHPVRAEADDLPLLRSYGPKADPADTRTIAALVKSFYADSAAGDGARACSLMYAELTRELTAQHDQAAPNAHETCATAMSALLRAQHQRLAGEDISTMVVIGVHVKHNLGLAVLGFQHSPESQIVVEREGHTWKIDALFGSYMP